MFSRVALKEPYFYRSALPAATRDLINGSRFIGDSSETDIDDRGWFVGVAGAPGVKANRLPNLSPARAEARFFWIRRLMKTTHLRANTDFLDRILSTLHQRGIQATLVTLPVWGTYSAGMDERYWARTQAVVADLTARYSVSYLCFLNVPELGREDFVSVDHLNPRGAERFTRILRHALQQTSSATSTRQTDSGACRVPSLP
jgi:hypothetical protein